MHRFPRVLLCASLAIPAAADIIWDLGLPIAPPEESRYGAAMPSEIAAPGPHMPMISATSLLAGGMARDNPAWPFLRSANHFIRQGKFDLALREAEEGLLLAPDDTTLLHRAAICATIIKKYAQADRYFVRLIAGAPAEADFLVGRAGLLLRMGRLDEAGDLLGRALKVEPHHLLAHYFMSFLAVLGVADVQDPAAFWRRVTLEGLLQVASWLMADREDLEDVLPDGAFDSSCERMLGGGACAHLVVIRESLYEALAARRRGDRDAQARQLERAIASGLQGLYPAMERAKLLFESGAREEAAVALEKLAALYPDDAAVQYNCGYVYLKQSRFDDARAALVRSLELAPENTQAIFALACAEAGQGLLDEAWARLGELLQAGVPVADWLEGEAPYLIALRKDQRYEALLSP